MKFKARLKTVQIDRVKWDRRLEARLRKGIKRAATVWLNATVLLAVPVWSGASRATFLKLARAVDFPLTINARVTNADHPRALGIEVGLQQSQGSVSDVQDGKVTFTYGTTLFHLIFNELNNANANKRAGRVFAQLREPGPYNFQKIGQAAFEDYAKDALELPSPWRSLKINILRVS